MLYARGAMPGTGADEIQLEGSSGSKVEAKLECRL